MEAIKRILCMGKQGPAFRQPVVQDIIPQAVVETAHSIDRVYLVTKAQYEAMPISKRMYIPPTL